MEATISMQKKQTMLLLLLLILIAGAAGAAAQASASFRTRRGRRQIQVITSLKANSMSKSNSSNNGGGQEFFEVKKPVQVPKEGPCAVARVVQQDFAFTYGKPPTVAKYTPPTSSSCKGGWTQAVLQWKASSKGIQFDRYAGVWLGGAEILRTTTAEPDETGVHWTVLKDITKYAALLRSPQTMEVQMYNLVNHNYTGIYHVNVSVLFYAAAGNQTKSSIAAAAAADVIVPLSLPSSHQGGAWFQISNPADPNSASFTVPTNSYRAVLEIFVSFHGSDELWYTNLQNDFIKANNLTTPGNGPFREILIRIDDRIVGAVWPFPVVYSGGFDPLFWRPVTGIGSFDLPSYDIEVTPFLGMLLDGKQHNLSFAVTNGLDYWLVDANLHIWTDKKTNSSTKGGLISYTISPSVPVSVKSSFKELNGSFLTSANRRISATGWVASASHGKLITRASNELKFSNLMVFKDNADDEMVYQKIRSTAEVSVRTSKGQPISSTKVTKVFPFGFHQFLVFNGGSPVSLKTNLFNGFNESKYVVAGNATFSSNLQDTQNIENVIGNSGETITAHQMYDYKSPQECYSRNVVVTDLQITSDTANTFCKPRI